MRVSYFDNVFFKFIIKLLGNYGPLKTRERQACQALQIQGRVLAKFHNLMEKIILNPSYLISANEELNGLPHLQVRTIRLRN